MTVKVKDLPYRRVTLEEIRGVLDDVLHGIREAEAIEDVLDAWKKQHDLMLEYTSNTALAYMRYSINTVDEFYRAENDCRISRHSASRTPKTVSGRWFSG